MNKQKLEMRKQKLETRNEKVEMTNENKQFKKNNTLKEEPKEIKSLNWFDKNEFKEILAIADIRNNTISETDAKTSLNTLNEIKNEGITKQKKRTSKQKELLNLFNNLSDIILTDKALESESQENENEKVESRKEENEKVESGKQKNKEEDYESKYENEDEDDYYEYENEDDDKTMDQNEIIKNLNYSLDEIIEKSKSFEDQIKL